jgi:hypothetical protein
MGMRRKKTVIWIRVAIQFINIGEGSQKVTGSRVVIALNKKSNSDFYILASTISPLIYSTIGVFSYLINAKGEVEGCLYKSRQCSYKTRSYKKVGHTTLILHWVLSWRGSYIPIDTVFQLSSMPSPSEPGPLGPHPLTGQYDDLLQIKAFLQAHARENGYAIIVQKTTVTVRHMYAATAVSAKGQFPRATPKADRQLVYIESCSSFLPSSSSLLSLVPSIVQSTKLPSLE